VPLQSSSNRLLALRPRCGARISPGEPGGGAGTGESGTGGGGSGGTGGGCPVIDPTFGDEGFIHFEKAPELTFVRNQQAESPGACASLSMAARRVCTCGSGR
jgi:hypothetical protein